MKKIYISPSSQKENLYATGKTNEQEQCNRIAKACYELLHSNGFETYVDYGDNMYERVKKSNEYGCDYHICIHTNATAKHNVTGGTQILLHELSGDRLKLGTKIFDMLSVITPGKTAEKIYARPDFYEIKNTKGICIYIECEFHDTAEGSNFIIENAELMGKQIARAICEYHGITTAEGKVYNVQVGSFRNKDNAIQMVKHCKKLGFHDSFIKEV